MNFFERFFFGKMETPLAFGSFHLIFLALFLALAIVLFVFFRKCSDKTFKRIVFISWAILVLFEIGKQINWNYDYTTKTWLSFNWSSFPYQFCSLPFYVWPLVCFMKNCKFRTCLCLFIGTYVFFGGLGYLFIPVSLCDRVLINHQTMIHHGLQSVVSLFILVHEFDKFSYKMFLQSTAFLIISIIIAITLNIILNPLGYINLFELNPLNPTEAAVFGDILKATNYPTFILVYIVGFFAFANAVYWSVYGIVKLVGLIPHTNKIKNA